jgi:medium-chain acyl-[acyl-carrier-protein] hydrolase
MVAPMFWQKMELRELLLPLLRADLTLVETYAHTPHCPCPARPRLSWVSQADLVAWRIQVSSDIRVQLFEGDYFYLNHAPQPLLQAIGTRSSENQKI